jgi:signal transduction histidine kinase
MAYFPYSPDWSSSGFRLRDLNIPILLSTVCVLAALLAGAIARPVELVGAIASDEIPEHEVSQLIDGNVGLENGWGVPGNHSEVVELIFRTREPLNAGLLLFSVVEITSWAEMAAKFDLAVTADEEPGFRGNWTPLKPEFAAASHTAVTVEGMAILPMSSGAVTVYATAPFAGITGFRLRFLPVDADRNPATPSKLGRGSGRPVGVTEFTVEADPLRSSNVAFGRPVTTSGRLFRNMPARFLTDGFAGTFSHPDTSLESKDFFFEVDLGQSRTLDHLVIRGRGDGVVPERLTKYEVQLLDGDAREVRWSAQMHPDGSHPGSGGSDVIRRDAGQGRMEGRFIRVINRSGMPNSPQIAELEAYPALRLAVEQVVADGVAVRGGVVPAGRKRLGFRIALRENIVPTEQAAFRWRIEGAVAEWREVDWRGVVETECPPPGSYLVAVQARHTDGIWDEIGGALTISVEFPWWRERRAIAGFSLLVIGLVAWIFRRLAVRRLQHQVRKLEHEQALNRERERIAQDMHDDVGAQLASLSILAERCVEDPSSLPKLGDRARAAVASLDEIVWAVNPRQDTLGALVDYLCKYAGEFLATARVKSRQQVAVLNRQRNVESSTRHHVLMAVKESLSNAVRHSGADEIWLRLREETGLFVVEVADCGCGLPATAVAPDADGLKNLRSRVAEIRGELNIVSEEGEGTTIQIKVPLSP